MASLVHLDSDVIAKGIGSALSAEELASLMHVNASLWLSLNEPKVWRQKCVEEYFSDEDIRCFDTAALASAVAVRSWYSAERTDSKDPNQSLASWWKALALQLSRLASESGPGSRLQILALCASSTHHHYESLKNALHPNPLLFWSSQPGHSATPEVLAFVVSGDHPAAFSEIEVQPYSHYYATQGISRAYAWRSCRICLWRLVGESRQAAVLSANVHEYLKNSIRTCRSAARLLPPDLGKLAFDSGDIDMPHGWNVMGSRFRSTRQIRQRRGPAERNEDNEVRSTIVQLPRLVIADVLAVELNGRLVEEEFGGGFYFCVQKVYAKGVIAPQNVPHGPEIRRESYQGDDLEISRRSRLRCCHRRRMAASWSLLYRRQAKLIRVVWRSLHLRWQRLQDQVTLAYTISQRPLAGIIDAFTQ
eukprot:TRINITY_DN15295_c0_g1_i1.p1 TRINITY_DN15295_c0_g1~~TRINITY_DN15295_c0_g1_i1.p1  ORF type:complete len:419 (+),score=41.82 TRINITY_DN15295_c0_g1_i1:117-1373(+)